MTTEQNRPEEAKRPSADHSSADVNGGQPLDTPPHQRDGGNQHTHGEHHRDEAARNPGLDPEPTETPGLEDGGGVQPGDTPPDSNSATASPKQASPTKPPKSNLVMTVAIIAIIVVVLLIFVGYIAGLLD
ncbi:DUF6480 family protein [Nesterenkonia sp. LB17]|uniref:DUF6480 family protein n=1 Tax=unclassified Nesterenkonia TaxID=2629769 RepID=UPI001F4CA8D9|nr:MULTISPECIES: DUF6480 family protein [unclassified Nesterenkonia]MCH8559572.1 DUF6480 family protein [Nesterenkonia sp. DZ6]MCH8564723.1 DUF6480 family protein [Nesterenkonia sp. LB17]MCH8570352.1 DUF6480 family protein [Nesterenkonia sp. AY15]